MVRSNYILVFNLATADLLMGIYLLILAIQNTTSAGRYSTYLKFLVKGIYKRKYAANNATDFKSEDLIRIHLEFSSLLWKDNS